MSSNTKSNYKSSEIDGEHPGVTFSTHPYEVGCDVHPTMRVHVDVLAAPGDGRGERIVVRSDGERFEYRWTAGGYLELASPANVEVPEWARTAIAEVGVGKVL